MFAKLPLVTLFISNLTRLTAVVCIKVRFEAKVTRGFSLAYATRSRRFAACCWSLSRRKIMKNLWDQGSIRLKLTLINRAIWFKLFKRTDRVLPWKMPYHVTVSDEISPICSAPYTKVLKNQWLPEFLSRQIKFNRARKLDSLLTRTVFRFASESQLPALYWTAFIYLLFHT